MAKKPHTKPATALGSPAGQALIRDHLAAAEHELAHGPGGGGWQYNESKRPEIEERAEFLRALVAQLPAAE